MQNIERRSDVRYALEVPLRFSLKSFNADTEVHTKATNVSRSGLFMESPTRLPIGCSVSVSLRVPGGISGSPFGERKGRGIVIHEDFTDDGSLGYGIRLQHAIRLRFRRKKTKAQHRKLHVANDRRSTVKVTKV